jgi:hypothetical protein
LTPKYTYLAEWRKGVDRTKNGGFWDARDVLFFYLKEDTGLRSLFFIKLYKSCTFFFWLDVVLQLKVCKKYMLDTQI